MKLFIDEDAGKGLGIKLDGTGFCDEIDWVDWGRRIQPGSDDEAWIPPISADSDLIISSNIHMLENRLQARLLVENAAGIVFIPNQAVAHERLKLVLNKEKWLRHMADRERRPFAWSINMTGRRYNQRLKLRKFSRLSVP